jgi:hypothetical protein
MAKRTNPPDRDIDARALVFAWIIFACLFATLMLLSGLGLA